jgi:hypothetical protein
MARKRQRELFWLFSRCGGFEFEQEDGLWFLDARKALEERDITYQAKLLAKEYMEDDMWIMLLEFSGAKKFCERLSLKLQACPSEAEATRHFYSLLQRVQDDVLGKRRCLHGHVFLFMINAPVRRTVTCGATSRYSCGRGAASR